MQLFLIMEYIYIYLLKVVLMFFCFFLSTTTVVLVSHQYVAHWTMLMFFALFVWKKNISDMNCRKYLILCVLPMMFLIYCLYHI